MDTAIDGFHHVKLPVADLARSREWYARVLGLQTHIEFTENGVLMGVGMHDPGGTISLALRHDPARAAALAGFDPVALRVPARPPWTPGSSAWTTSASRTAGSSPGTRAGC